MSVTSTDLITSRRNALASRGHHNSAALISWVWSAHVHAVQTRVGWFCNRATLEQNLFWTRWEKQASIQRHQHKTKPVHLPAVLGGSENAKESFWHQHNFQEHQQWNSHTGTTAQWADLFLPKTHCSWRWCVNCSFVALIYACLYADMSHTGAKALQAAFFPEHIVIDDDVPTAPLIRVRVLICRNAEILV